MRCLNRIDAGKHQVLTEAAHRLERVLRAHHAGRPAAWAEKVRDCLAEVEIILTRHRTRSAPAANITGLVGQAKLVRQDAERIVKHPSPDRRTPAKLLDPKRLVSQCAWIRLRGRGLLTALHHLY